MIGVHDMEASLDFWRRYLQGICALTPSHVGSRTDLLARLAGRMSREVVHFSYTKTDRSLRHAYGTLSWDIVSRYVDPERIASGGRHVPMAVFTYFDIERKAWRSFNVSRLEGIEDSYSI